jgi:hypothetical protein
MNHHLADLWTHWDSPTLTPGIDFEVKTYPSGWFVLSLATTVTSSNQWVVLDVNAALT